MQYYEMISFVCLIFFQPTIKGIEGLRDMHMNVPEAVRLGDTITLSCDYDLESVALYTIKWYRNEEEFYRFVPKESPPSRVFVMPHLHVDVSRSNSREVTLRDVERETSGIFKCEVSADAPLFQTDMRSSTLLVAEIPEEEPVLRSDVHKITPGARMTANCTTPGSYPFMNVTWLINDEDAHQKPAVQVHNSVVYYDALPGLETVRSTIVINSTQELFKSGRMKLSCVASMYSLYKEIRDMEIMEDTPQIAPIREHSTHNLESVNSSTTNSVPRYFMRFSQFLIFSTHLWMRRMGD